MKTLYSDSVLGTFPLVTIFPAPLAVRGSPLPATYIDVTFPRLVLFHREKCPHLPVLPLAYTVYPSESVGDWVQDLLWILKPVDAQGPQGILLFAGSTSVASASHALSTVCCYCSVAKSCLTLCEPMDCSLPGSSDHGISQVRILGWVAVSFSRGSS